VPHYTSDSVRVELPRGGHTYERQNRRWTGTYKGYGEFCTLRCAAAYANAEFKRTGMRYRRVKGS
jgi:hypothetical protein